MLGAGLILEGGGMRGVYTAGVLDFFMDQGLQFPSIYGVSAGVCHASSYLSGQRGRAMRTVADYIGDRRYASAYSLLTTGDFFGVDFVYREIPDSLIPFDYDAFKASPVKLWAVLTNCATGQADYLPVKDMHRDIRVIQASSSLPLLSRMVEIDGAQYLDGGISDSIPLKKAMDDGMEKNVVILTQHPGYQKGPDSMMPLVKLRYRAYPKLTESIQNRHIMYNQTLELIRNQEETGKVFVIQPRMPVTIGRLEKDGNKLEQLYQDGYTDAKASYERLSVFLERD